MTKKLASLGAYTFGAIAVFFASPISTAQAQETESEEAFEIVNRPAEDKKVFVFDFGVPSSPALTLLDVDKDKITQSNSLKPFVISLPGILSSGGEGRAVALDGSIGAFLIPAVDQQYGRYERRALIFRTRFNLGMYEGVSDDDASKQKRSRVAVGVSSSLLNSSDPLLASVPGGKGSSYIACLDSISRDAFPVPTGDQKQDEAAIENFKKTNALNSLIPTCMEVADLSARLGSDLDFGGGLLLEGKPGEFEDLDEEAGVFWGSFRTSLGARGPRTSDSRRGTSFEEYRKWAKDFGRWFMVGASVRAGISETVATGDTTTPEIRADTITAWAGLESYSKTNRFAAQVGLQRIDPAARANVAFGGNRTVYSVSFDQALGDTGLWFSLSYGKAEGRGALKSDSTALLTLTFHEPTARRIFGGS